MQNGAVLTNGVLELLMSDLKKMLEIHNFSLYWTAEQTAITLS